MFHDVSPEMAGLVGNWCSALLYGITVVTYVVCMYVLVKRRGDRSLSATWTLIGTSTVQYILASTYVAIGLRLLIEGFIHTENVSNGAFLYWIDPEIRTQVIEKFIYFTNTVIGDWVLIWRVYMVWGQNIYICIPPIILTCCSMGTGFTGLGKVSQITAEDPTSVFAILNWIISSLSLTMATQVISTVMIAGKIWWHAKGNPVSRSRYMSLIAIVVESGAILTLSSTFLLVCVVLKTQAGAILPDIQAQIATIIPTLIIIRVELIRSKTLDTMCNTDLSGKKQTLVSNSRSHGFGHRREESSLQVSVSTLATSDSEKELKCLA